MAGWTKRQFVTAAFEEIGVAVYEFDLQPEQLQSALRRLDSMMAFWNGKGIRVGYPLPSSPDDSSLDQETEVPDRFNESIISNLAIRLAPSMGKVINPATTTTAQHALDALMARAAMPGERQLPSGTPAGAGYKATSPGNEWLTGPTNSLVAGPDSELSFD